MLEAFGLRFRSWFLFCSAQPRKSSPVPLPHFEISKLVIGSYWSFRFRVLKCFMMLFAKLDALSSQSRIQFGSGMRAEGNLRSGEDCAQDCGGAEGPDGHQHQPCTSRAVPGD